MMKKWIVLMFCAAAMFGLAACGGRQSGGNEIAASNAISESIEAETADAKVSESNEADMDVSENIETLPVQESSTADSEQEANEAAQASSSEDDGQMFSVDKQDKLRAESIIIAEQILNGAEGAIHYSYSLPKNYDESKSYPMMVALPGRNMMWSGEQSSGSNLGWRGFLAWRKLSEDMIVVSAQLTDWGEKSARQTIELTEYFLANFPVNPGRVYACGYSAGGETMSQAVAMRPDLYAAYLHCASKWDGTFEPIAQNNVAVYIFMAENDEAYGSQKARDDYQGLYDAYLNLGFAQEQIDELLHVEIPDNEYFNSRGIFNYHGGVSILFEDEAILQWIMGKRKDG